MSVKPKPLSEAVLLPPGSEVTVSGWVEDLRQLGSLVFITLRDRDSSLQVVFNKKTVTPDVFAASLSVPRQSYVQVAGKTQSSRSRVSPIEVMARSFAVVGVAKHPLPLDPTGRVEANLDVRLDSRALDLRNPAVASIFRVRSSFLGQVRGFLTSEGFLEVNTAKVIGAAAEGGAELFKLRYFDRDGYLAQSPQLYKEELTLSLGKVFEIGTYFRAERSHTTRHLNEFVSLDIEAAMFRMEDAMNVLERMLNHCTQSLSVSNSPDFERLGVKLAVPPIPFPRVTYTDAIAMVQKKGSGISWGDDLDSDALRLLGEEFSGYYFIKGWPSSAKPFYIKPSEEDPKVSESFDLMFGALELASGGERVNSRARLEQRLLEKGLGLKEFSEHLKAYDWGMPPHSGWGFGVDRYVTVLTGRGNIREAVLFPRDDVRLTP